MRRTLKYQPHGKISAIRYSVESQLVANRCLFQLIWSYYTIRVWTAWRAPRQPVFTHLVSCIRLFTFCPTVLMSFLRISPIYPAFRQLPVQKHELGDPDGPTTTEVHFLTPSAVLDTCVSSLCTIIPGIVLRRKLSQENLCISTSTCLKLFFNTGKLV